MVSMVGGWEQKHVHIDLGASDCESSVCEPISAKPSEVYGDGTKSLREGDQEFVLLKNRFYTSIGSLAQHCSVVAAAKNMHSTPMGRAQMEAFRCYLKATTEKRNGNPNLTTGWYGASKNEIRKIMNDGFGACRVPEDNGFLGFGLKLYPDSSAIDSVLSAAVDGNGLRHIVICRVILGNTEEVHPGTEQYSSSSEKFDSGVDNLLGPKRYIIWYPNVNTHILPLYVLSVKLDFRSRGIAKEHARKPTSPWVPFDILIPMLSKSLPPSTMCLIRQYHNDYMERKITRQQLIRHLREVSGDRLLINAIKSFRNKKINETVAISS